jgi:hypothetical protein
VIGSENSDPTSDVRLIGFISANSPQYGFDWWRTSHRVTIEDTLCWQNTNGDYRAGHPFTVVRPRNGDPRFRSPANGDFQILPGSPAIGIISATLWDYVPPTDILGNPRVTADAGAWAA